jgi:hypothetical protein
MYQSRWLLKRQMFANLVFRREMQRQQWFWEVFGAGSQAKDF